GVQVFQVRVGGFFVENAGEAAVAQLHHRVGAVAQHEAINGLHQRPGQRCRPDEHVVAGFDSGGVVDEDVGQLLDTRVLAQGALSSLAPPARFPAWAQRLRDWPFRGSAGRRRTPASQAPFLQLGRILLTRTQDTAYTSLCGSTQSSAQGGARIMGMRYVITDDNRSLGSSMSGFAHPEPTSRFL